MSDVIFYIRQLDDTSSLCLPLDGPLTGMLVDYPALVAQNQQVGSEVMTTYRSPGMIPSRLSRINIRESVQKCESFLLQNNL